MIAKFVQFNQHSPFLTFDEVVIPDLKDGEILVKVKYTSLCRSDLNTFIGKRNEKTPTILGHEIVGTIIKLDGHSIYSDLNNVELKIGDLITWGIYASDPSHSLSKRGIPQKANDLFKYGHEAITSFSHLHGGLADHIIIRKNTPVIKLSSDIPIRVASLINCSVATVAGSIRLAGDLHQKNILVLGAGMLGVMATSMLKTEYDVRVTLVDISEKRLKDAKAFGADQFMLFSDLSASRNEYDIVFEYSGSNDSMECSIKKLTIGGTVIWIGGTFPQVSLRINAEEVIRKLLTIKGLHNYNTDDFRRAVSFVEKAHDLYPFDHVFAPSFKLESTREAFEYALEHNPLRVGIEF